MFREKNVANKADCIKLKFHIICWRGCFALCVSVAVMFAIMFAKG